jgi:quercetin dioxygenase-like cupin family protein
MVSSNAREEEVLPMSKMVVEKDYFRDRAAVMEDIRDTGYWPTTFVSNKSPELPVHYHDHDIIGYVISGETYLLDEDENKVPIGPGDRLVIPKGSWHAEGEVSDQVIYIVSVREPVPILEAIMPREARGPFPSFD